MKIISVDNFDRDNVSDQLIADNVSEYYGAVMVQALNAKYGDDHSDWFFHIVPDDYKIYEFEGY